MKDKIKTLAAARKVRAAAKGRKKVVFTNGCFDLLHAGHVAYLEAARSKGDLLIVGLNDDASLRRLKGKGRPLVAVKDRAAVLAGLAAVDVVVVFGEDDPGKLIAALLPDVLVKGADWAADKIIGADVVKARGGKVVRVPLTKGQSTSAIIAKVLDRYRSGKVKP